MYLGKQATSSSYGAAGSVVVILLWVYYASVIMFLGAEFTQAYANETGMAIQPDQYAEKTDEDANGKSKHPAKSGEPRDELRPAAGARWRPEAAAPFAAIVAFAVGVGAAFGFRRRR
jgi:membrane protein